MPVMQGDYRLGYEIATNEKNPISDEQELRSFARTTLEQTSEVVTDVDVDTFTQGYKDAVGNEQKFHRTTQNLEFQLEVLGYTEEKEANDVHKTDEWDGYPEE